MLQFTFKLISGQCSPLYKNESIDLLANQLVGFCIIGVLLLNGLVKFSLNYHIGFHMKSINTFVMSLSIVFFLSFFLNDIVVKVLLTKKIWNKVFSLCWCSKNCSGHLKQKL